MSKRHTIYVLVTVDGKFRDAFLSYSAAVREKKPGDLIVTLYDREDY